LRTYALLQRPEELLALVRAEDAFVLQEVLYNQLLHRLLLHANLVDFGLYGRSVHRVGRYCVNEADVQIDDSVPHAIDAADESIPAGHHASSLITVQAHFLVRKRRPSGQHLIDERSDKRHVEADREDDGKCSYRAFHRAVSR
jgi:hypothetical protein